MSSNVAKISPNAHLSIPDPEWTEFYAENANKVPQLVGSPQHLRDMMERLKVEATGMIPQITGLSSEDIRIKTSDGASILVRVYTPATKKGLSPGLVYIHGGGWTLGDLEGEDIACRAMCVNGGVVVVSVDYRLAPENPFPTGLDDCWDALLWTRSQSHSLGIEQDCISIGGSSSGGNITAVLAHRARNLGIRLKGQILRIPATCHIDCYPPELNLRSLEDLKDAPLLSKRSMELFYGYYNPSDPSNPDVSPLLNTNFHGLAPAYFQVAGLDPLRDEGLAYANKLKEAGVPTRVDVYPGVPHAFYYFPSLTAAAKSSTDLLEAIGQLTKGELK
ncbi:Alpha/Beta hydrolase protein [Ilyonectria sp. MPI-CAGE-AT-0026]|nr:Alpha/Beta hydrolase protein [Ilyonectria sp. MPI-CAGE-AT-0026]